MAVVGREPRFTICALSGRWTNRARAGNGGLQAKSRIHTIGQLRTVRVGTPKAAVRRHFRLQTEGRASDRKPKETANRSVRRRHSKTGKDSLRYGGDEI